MRRYRYVTVDVFTTRRFGGNPLAVFTDANGLSSEEMQLLTAELRLSEATFVLPPDDSANTARVRIFDPVAEMAFAGHPNVGTALVLAEAMEDRPDRLRFEELAGLVEIAIDRDADGRPAAAAVTAPIPLATGCEVPPELVAACAGIDLAQILAGTHAPIRASVGHPFVLAEVRPDALAAATPDLAAFRRAVEAVPGLEGDMSLLLYARDGGNIRARMFAPLAGIWEDPATGSANAALAGLLLERSGEASARFDVRQGEEMGRPSLLHLAAWRAPEGIRTSVKGACVRMFEGEALLD